MKRKKRYIWQGQSTGNADVDMPNSSICSMSTRKQNTSAIMRILSDIGFDWYIYRAIKNQVTQRLI